MSPKGVSITETMAIEKARTERFYSDDEILELFPDGDGSLVNPLLRRAQKAEAEIERLKAIAKRASRARMILGKAEMTPLINIAYDILCGYEEVQSDE